MLIECDEAADCLFQGNIFVDAFFLGVLFNFIATVHLNTTDQVDLRDGIGLAMTNFQSETKFL